MKVNSNLMRHLVSIKIILIIYNYLVIILFVNDSMARNLIVRFSIYNVLNDYNTFKILD